MHKSIHKTLNNFYSWMQNQMFSFNDASWGIYERIRIDINQRVCWVRPDCNSEFAKYLALYNLKHQNKYKNVYENITNWLLKSQYLDKSKATYGAYPFWLADGDILIKRGEVIWQNDNGKILINLCELYENNNDKRLLDSAIKLADFWTEIYLKYNEFHIPVEEMKSKDMNVSVHRGACFNLWLMAGLYKIYQLTKNELYKNIADQALNKIFSLINGDRILTSYETAKTEDWRPVSSENVIALNCLSIAYKVNKNEKVLDAIKLLLKFINKLQDKTGCIINGLEEHNTTSLNNDPDLCDYVYTQGFAINALIETYEAIGDEKALQMAKKLSKFLIKTQCKNESKLWDGSWRGSYSIKNQTWAGRCNQNNPTDEGGMYSVYTGWSSVNIAIGLLRMSNYLK